MQACMVSSLNEGEDERRNSYLHPPLMHSCFSDVIPHVSSFSRPISEGIRQLFQRDIDPSGSYYSD
ncbi:hypothetical protein K501DRAFT_288281 [Backusella circina FSU 941]|nr:hypothetical protein K501DRAFT_288281 [Backusella circina FSU 941]